MSRASVGLFVSLSVLPASARAFSDYELFPLPPLEGGGGGRYFTGSSSDGFTCGVCHLGGAKPVVQLVGLPEREFVAGTAYELELAWQAPQAPHALNLEFVTPNGRAAGSIVLPDPASLTPADLCDAAHGGGPATHLIEESLPRQVLWVDDCGAQRVRFRYQAPNEPRLMFAAAIVQSDASEKPEGDGVTELRRDLLLQGTASSSDEGCSLGRRPGQARGAWSLALLALGGALFAVRRRR